MISCFNFIGVTLKEKAPNTSGTLVDVGLNKVLSASMLCQVHFSSLSENFIRFFCFFF